MTVKTTHVRLDASHGAVEATNFDGHYILLKIRDDTHGSKDVQVSPQMAHVLYCALDKLMFDGKAIALRYPDGT